MKVRLGFVTNSSSSSFIIARRPILSQAQKDAIISIFENTFLGTPMDPETLDEYCECSWNGDTIREDAESANASGLILSGGTVSMEEPGSIAYLFQRIWNALERADPEGFRQIDTSLEY